MVTFLRELVGKGTIQGHINCGAMHNRMFPHRISGEGAVHSGCHGSQQEDSCTQLQSPRRVMLPNLLDVWLMANAYFVEALLIFHSCQPIQAFFKP